MPRSAAQRRPHLFCPAADVTPAGTAAGSAAGSAVAAGLDAAGQADWEYVRVVVMSWDHLADWANQLQSRGQPNQIRFVLNIQLKHSTADKEGLHCLCMA